MGAQVLKNSEFCCELMQKFLDERKVGIHYNPIIRSYYIATRKFEDGTQIIYHCPWCGSKLPKNLLDEYYGTLKKEYNILFEPHTKRFYEILDIPNRYTEVDRELPKEFKSNTWWKTRNL